MNILIITYSYAPALTPRAFRWTTIAEYWASKGWRVDVLCTSISGIAETETKNGVNIHRLHGGIEKLRQRLKEVKQNSKNNSDNIKALNGLINSTSYLQFIHNHTWKKIYWPDYACLWYFPALRKAKKLLKANNYDALITVSHPFTGHLVGLQLKRRCLNIPWILDIGDPFSFLNETPLNNRKIYNRLNYIYEKDVLDLADTVSVTTEQTLAKYTEVFPENSQKIKVIPPLISLPTAQSWIDHVFNNDEKIRLVFVGTLYKNIREPDFLLMLFERLLGTELADQLELHFFGNSESCHDCFKSYEYLVDLKIFIHGLVDHSRAIQAMKEADVLINIGNNTVYQLPSKVVEYAAMVKPVLNLAKTITDISNEFFNKYPLSFCLIEESSTLNFNEFNDLVEFIRCSANKIDVKNSKEIQDWLVQFTIDSVAQSYEDLIIGYKH